MIYNDKFWDVVYQCLSDWLNKNYVFKPATPILHGEITEEINKEYKKILKNMGMPCVEHKITLDSVDFQFGKFSILLDKLAISELVE